MPTNSGAASPVIAVQGLQKRYGNVEAVSGVDLEITAGECFALLGPNGAGKTTTVEILEGYRRRDGGTVSVLGTDPETAGAAWRARIGIVLQNATDNGALTVTETVRLFAGYYPRPRDVGEVIDLVGLTEKRSTRTVQLSGGQRRRLDVALGIVGRPELLFLDEPTTGFDPEARRHFWSLIEDLKESGTTIVLTTHYLDEAEHLADRVAVISRGRVLASGPPSTLGGRRQGLATVQWVDGTGVERSIETTTPTAEVRRLLAAAGPDEIPGLRISRPNLEDVYLTLIGSDEAVQHEGA
jgi:ABC-2 type transport system ATP-binding protein